MYSSHQELQSVDNNQKAVTEFKRPQNVQKRVKVLTEEKYIEEMSKIIQRDFFPDLEKLQAQNEYLDAMDRNDMRTMDAIRSKYSTQRRNTDNTSMTPATFETPSTNYMSTPNPSVADHAEKACSDEAKQSETQNLSLDAFLQHYTSEDNYSFEEIIKNADAKLRKKFDVLYQEETNCSENLKRALCLPSIEDQFTVSKEPKRIETWTYTNKNSIMYIPEGVNLTEEEKHKAVVNRQSIQHGATRLSKTLFSKTDHSKNQSDQSDQSDIIEREQSLISGKPAGIAKIRGFDLIQTPSPRPGEAFSPLMTWGEIEGTPFRLDGSDTPISSNVGPSFKIAENSRRENIALELAENVGKKLRAQKIMSKNAVSKSSPFIRSNMQRLASMSPAARRLATSKLGLRSELLTPSPMFTPNVTPKTQRSLSKKSITTPSNPKVVPTTPDVVSATTSSTSSTASTLTDDLLKIPTNRLKAADFF